MNKSDAKQSRDLMNLRVVFIAVLCTVFVFSIVLIESHMMNLGHCIEIKDNIFSKFNNMTENDKTLSLMIWNYQKCDRFHLENGDNLK